MPGLSVDGSGNVTGTIVLADGDLVAGQHEIEINGSGGTVAKGRYNNDPRVPVAELRKLYVTTDNGELAPLAQSFKVNTERDLIAVKLDIDIVGGTDDVVVQIREMENGIPSPSKILAEGRVVAGSIAASGTYTRFALNPPVPLLTDREYCFTVQANDVDYTIAVAELGGVDLVTGNAIASQPNAGVMLTSSNGTSWSIEQNKDIKFQLIGATYATLTKEVDLGDIAGTDISDFLVLGTTEVTDKDGQVYYIITDPDANTYTLAKGQKLILGAKKTGDFNVKAVIKGSATRSPILYPNTELVLGEINASGNYFSKKFAVPDSFDVKLIVEAKAIASGSYTPYIEDTSTDNYTALTLSSSEVMNDGWIRSTWAATTIAEVGTSNLSSIKIAASSPTIASRIFLRNLIVFTE